MPKKIFIIAGEASGDLHGSSLISEIKKISPDTAFIGMGGPLMAGAGLRSFQDIGELSVIGLGEVIASLDKFKSVFRLLTEKLDGERPDCVVLIDYPEFNLRFAREAKKRGIPVAYYISPQIWAWRRGRVKDVRKYVDKMLVILGFEKDFYAKYGVDAEFVGHPLLDSVVTLSSRAEFLQRHGLDASKKTVALLPGSRRTEVEKNLPLMAEAAELIGEKFGNNVQFMVAKPGGMDANLYEEALGMEGFRPELIEDEAYDCVNAADLVLVASGTATLETTILEKPMVIIYRVSLLTWLFGKLLVKIPHIGLVNIVAGSRIVPEFVGFRISPSAIADEAVSILRSPARSEGMKTHLAAIRDKLGGPGASRRAAEAVLKIIL
ncbi:MAG: lipid-A-disaccharide synthase [Candidatus Omnitrophica bacterium]|nr:lipid-A-disaccharide synthase [Candidatus Omnitrophota bacterium]MDD5737198.1 lipid-A-disaccharide synthase [Candidatus Omnitrophota bacterium]